MSSAKRKAQGKVKALVQPAAEDDEMSFPLVSVDKRKAKKATLSAVKGTHEQILDDVGARGMARATKQSRFRVLGQLDHSSSLLGKRSGRSTL